MKRNLVQLFFIALQRSLKTTNVTSLVELITLSSRHIQLHLDIQITQLMTSPLIMSIFEIADFVAYDSKKQLKLCCNCV